MKHPLHAYRESRQLTQKGMADLLGCSQTLISLIENGDRSVSKDNAEKWEGATGIPRLTLMFPDEYPHDGPHA